jgi:hypothetical protein
MRIAIATALDAFDESGLIVVLIRGSTQHAARDKQSDAYDA